VRAIHYLLQRQALAAVLIAVALVVVVTASFIELFASLIESRTLAESCTRILVGLLLLLALSRNASSSIGVGHMRKYWPALPLMGFVVPLYFLLDRVRVTELVYTRDQAIAWLLRNLASGVWEESLFRGVCFYLLYRAWNSSRAGLWTAAITQALLFGALHLTSLAHDELDTVLFQIARAICAGLGLAGLMVWSRSIWPAVLLHACINAAGSFDNFFAGPGYAFPAYSTLLRSVELGIMFLCVALPGAWCLQRTAAESGWVPRAHIPAADTLQ
jgi:membrane protease YdiL (CAAX protease family)